MIRRLAAVSFVLACLAQPAGAAVGDNSVGMNIHLGRQGFIDACADLGVRWVRMDANWFQLEPADGSYDWTAMDQAVDRAAQAGLQVYLTLAYTPAWVGRHGDTDGSPQNDVPNDAADWSGFVRQAVAHYRARGVTHFGIWNEPNLGGFFEGTVDEYVDVILLPGAQAVRQGCQDAGFSDCLVLGPDLANVGEVDVYLDDVLSSIPAGTLDILAHHTYQGFAETGWNIFSGDSFINVLDQQRCPLFCRRDLRQILDAHGFTGEVWITETGYRADPPGDAAAEDLQAVYVRRVLEEQLGRAWYTNSFFYEILDCRPDQPDCTIDGYGLMRATSGAPGSRVYPDDYRRKPAFFALQQFIADHPEITGLEPPAACGDGQDNDGDGLVDLADRGCADAFDDDESDDPPRQELSAYRSPGAVIDGELADLGPDGWLELGPQAWQGTEPLGDDDLTVRIAVRWTDDGLIVGLAADDDVHDNDQPADRLWLGDSLQLAFDLDRSGGAGYDDTDDHEITVALAGGQPLAYRQHGPAGAADDFELQVVRQAGQTRYELALPADCLPGLDLQAGSRIGFSFLVNDADGNGRAGWLEWTPGIGLTKVPGYFGELVLSAETSGPDTDGGVDAGDDGGPDADPDGGVDAGADSRPDAGLDGSDEPDGAPQADGDDQPADDGSAGTDRPADPVPDGGSDPTDGSGCGCATHPARSPSPAWLPGLLLLLILLRRRA